MKAHSDIEPTARKAGASRIEEAFQSFSVLPGIEELGSTALFPELRQKAEQAVSRATFENRCVAVFHLAVFRSARYAMANGAACHIAGMRGSRQALLAGARLLHPLKTTL